MRTKYKQPYATQSEVICTLTHQLEPSLTIVVVYPLTSHHRLARLRSRHCMTSLPSGSCARGSVTHKLIRLPRYRCIYQHTQTGLSSQLRILLLMLVISMSPNSCSGGACAHAHPKSGFRPNVNLSHLNVVAPRNVVISSFKLLR